MSSPSLPALILAAAILVSASIAYRTFRRNGDVGRDFTAADYRSMPSSFDTVAEARSWARGNSTGGRVDQLSIPGPDAMVVFQHGSGFPVVQIGVYQRQGFHWKLIAVLDPPIGVQGDQLRATASGRQIFVRSTRTNLSAPLINLS